MDDATFFPEVPEDLSSLDDEQVESLISEHKDALASIATGEAYESMDEQPDRNTRIEQLKSLRDSLLALQKEQADRATEAETFNAEVAEIVAEAGVTLKADKNEDEDPGVEDGVDEDSEEPVPAEAEASLEVESEEPEVEAPVEEPVEAPVPVAAAAAPVRYTRPPATPRRNQPLRAPDNGPVLVAAAGSNSIREGTPLDRDALAALTAERLRHFVGSTPAGLSEKVVIASARWDGEYSNGQRLDGQNMHTDMGKINQAREEKRRQSRELVQSGDGFQSLVAAGGFCAPSTVRYDVNALGTQARPVRDALTPFNAVRGGISFVPDMSISGTDVSGAISNITEAQDIAGGTAGTKDCLVVDCPDFGDVRADIIATCLQAGNLMQAAYPELIAAWQDLVGVAAARNRDSALLTAIATDPQTKSVTYPQQYGALYSLVAAYTKAAAGYRSRHRLDDQEVLRALAPAWLADLIALDLVGRQFPFEDGGVSRGSVAALIQRLTSVSVTWYLDSAAGDGQIFDAQSEGVPVDPFPVTAVSFLYPEGGILFVDAGELNLGLVRDSVLNATNDAQFFAEVFETATVIAAEAIEITSTICPTGTTAGTATAITC